MSYPNPYPNNVVDNFARTISMERKAQTNVVKVALAIVGVLMALLLGLLVLLVIGISTGPVAFMIGLVTGWSYERRRAPVLQPLSAK